MAEHFRMEWGGQHKKEWVCLVAQFASWNVIVLALTHFEYSMTRLIELQILRF
jgi:hypothetical protein